MLNKNNPNHRCIVDKRHCNVASCFVTNGWKVFVGEHRVYERRICSRHKNMAYDTARAKGVTISKVQYINGGNEVLVNDDVTVNVNDELEESQEQTTSSTLSSNLGTSSSSSSSDLVGSINDVTSVVVNSVKSTQVSSNDLLKSTESLNKLSFVEESTSQSSSTSSNDQLNTIQSNEPTHSLRSSTSKKPTSTLFSNNDSVEDQSIVEEKEVEEKDYFVKRGECCDPSSTLVAFTSLCIEDGSLDVSNPLSKEIIDSLDINEDSPSSSSSSPSKPMLDENEFDTYDSLDDKCNENKEQSLNRECPINNSMCSGKLWKLPTKWSVYLNRRGLNSPVFLCANHFYYTQMGSDKYTRRIYAVQFKTFQGFLKVLFNKEAIESLRNDEKLDTFATVGNNIDILNECKSPKVIDLPQLEDSLENMENSKIEEDELGLKQQVSPKIIDLSQLEDEPVHRKPLPPKKDKNVINENEYDGDRGVKYWHNYIHLKRPSKVPIFNGGRMSNFQILSLFEYFCGKLQIDLEQFHVGIGTLSNVLKNIKSVERKKRKKFFVEFIFENDHFSCLIKMDK